jgi:hypothetical protein
MLERRRIRQAKTFATRLTPCVSGRSCGSACATLQNKFPSMWAAGWRACRDMPHGMWLRELPSSHFIRLFALVATPCSSEFVAN